MAAPPNQKLTLSMLTTSVTEQARRFEADFNYKNFNQAEAETALKNIYARIGLPPPLTIWCQNPAQLTNLPCLMEYLRLTNGTRGERTNAIKKLQKLPMPPRGFQRDAVVGIWRRLQELNEQDKYIPFGRALGSELNSLLMRSLPSELAEATDAVVTTDGRQLIQSEVSGVMVGFLSLLKETWERGADRPSPIEDELVRNNSTLSLDADLRVNTSWGIWDLYWMFGFHSINEIYSQQILEPHLSEVLNDFITLMKNGSPYLLFENICFACHYPVVRTTDNAHRWHNETGPALAFSCGLELHFWHGTIIPEQLIKRRRSINPLAISLQPNATLRSIMMEIYGWERYLKDSKAKIIDTDNRGTLYRLDFKGQEPLVAVSVLNSTAEPDGTFKRYTLRVPPRTQTVQEALAWTFDLRPKEYCPDVET